MAYKGLAAMAVNLVLALASGRRRLLDGGG